MKTSITVFWAALMCMALTQIAFTTGEDRRQEPLRGFFRTDIPEYTGNVILGRPTDSSIILSILSHTAMNAVVIYGPEGKPLSHKAGPFEIKAGEPKEVLLDGLEPNTGYLYRVLNAATEEPMLPEKANGRFMTQRSPGSPFVFTVIADSHLDENSETARYTAALKNVISDKPDFHIDLGDTFMTGKHRNRETAALQYQAQRYYFGLIGYFAPVYLVLGNHDGEETFRPEFRGQDGLATWACMQRKRFFPNPVPDAFYSGNSTKDPYAGLLENFYSWTWGDALFVVLDPYWTSKGNRGGKDPWGMTLGRNQYDWLAATLSASHSKYKFVFIHQLVGGLDKSGRGGSEAAPLFEWGGHEIDGKDTFAANRPGWEKPVHSLLIENKVTIVFHGHDHFYARQELDNVLYQLVPQPAARNSRNFQAEEYGYKNGTLRPSSGHIRVKVSPDKVLVDYINSSDGSDVRNQDIPNSKTVYSYTCGIDQRQEQ